MRLRCAPTYRSNPSTRRGAAAVELAVVLPFLLLLLLLVIDFGRVFYGSQTVSVCSQGGVFHESFRSDAIGLNESPYATYRDAAAADGQNLNLKPTEDISAQYGTATDGNPMVGVSTTYRLSTVSGALPIPDTYDVKRTVWMREVPLTPKFP